ncbi:MAG TPA: hypothetical protein V6D12_02520, partial [Candidatus Obscuribacterales bacterium]
RMPKASRTIKIVAEESVAVNISKPSDSQDLAQYSQATSTQSLYRQLKNYYIILPKVNISLHINQL